MLYQYRKDYEKKSQWVFFPRIRTSEYGSRHSRNELVRWQ